MSWIGGRVQSACRISAVEPIPNREVHFCRMALHESAPLEVIVARTMTFDAHRKGEW